MCQEWEINSKQHQRMHQQHWLGMAPGSCFRRLLRWLWDVPQFQCSVPAQLEPLPSPCAGRNQSTSLHPSCQWCASYSCVQTDKITYPAHGRSCGQHPGPWTKGIDFQLSHKSSLWLVLVFVLSPYFTVCLHSLWEQLFAQILIPCFHNDTEAAVCPVNYDFSVGDYCFSFFQR